MPVTVSCPSPSVRAWVVGLSMALLPLVVPAAQAAGTAAAAAPTYTLEDLLTQARLQSPALATNRARIEAVQAGLITARALPNPELGIEPGRLNPGRPGERGASSFAMSFAQPIENPRLRAARLASAEGQVAVARADGVVLETVLRSAIRDRFFELLKQRAEQAALQEDLKLAEQIRDRIALRVQVGEAARFDVLRAEGEVALVRRQLDAVGLRLRETRLLMRQLVGPGLVENFEVATSEADNRLLGEGDVQALRRELSERNPDIAQARASLEGSRRQLELERSRVVPQLSLRAIHERDGPAQLTRVGAQITVPLLDRRAGPIAEAIAEGERARLALEQRRFETEAAFEAAWVAYRTALAQVQAIEGGVLDRARQVLAIAEAAYRLGERGILEFLDAQRQFRQVRNELIGARLDLQRARTDLERLAGR